MNFKRGFYENIKSYTSLERAREIETILKNNYALSSKDCTLSIIVILHIIIYC